MKTGETIVPPLYRMALDAIFRNQEWNKRFGPLAEIGEVKTIVNGNDVTLTPKDVLLRLAMRVGDFTRVTGLADDPVLTYAAAAARLTPQTLSALDTALDSLNTRSSGFAYFRYVDRSSSKTFHLRGDYDALRTTRYVPAERERAQAALAAVKAVPPPAPAPVRPLVDAGLSAPAGRGRAEASPAASSAGAGRCDALAGHPEDAGRIGPGVADEAINADAAIAACSASVTSAPHVGRLQFQLGRAYWAVKRYDEAIEAFLAADELEYTPADYYLGLAYEQGLVDGPADLAMASDLYLIAASDGFRPAVEAYQGIEWDWDIDYSSMSNPALAKLVYEFDPAQPQTITGTSRDLLSSYMSGASAFMSLAPNEFDASCPAIAQAEIGANVLMLAREAEGLPRVQTSEMADVAWIFQRASHMSFTDGIEEAKRMGRLNTATQEGTDDIYSFVADYGGCDGGPLQRFYRNMGAIADLLLKR